MFKIAGKIRYFIPTVCLFLISMSSFSQSKEFRNSLTPTFPSCENSSDKEKCYRENVGNLIAVELNKSNIDKPDKIQIELLIRTEVDGKSTMLKIKNDDAKIIQITKIALEKMPLITPLKSLEGKNVTSSYGFFVTLIKSKQDDKYSVL